VWCHVIRQTVTDVSGNPVASIFWDIKKWRRREASFTKSVITKLHGVIHHKTGVAIFTTCHWQYVNMKHVYPLQPQLRFSFRFSVIILRWGQLLHHHFWHCYQLLNVNESTILVLVWLFNHDLENVWEEVTSFKPVQYLIICSVGGGRGETDLQYVTNRNRSSILTANIPNAVKK
jgi:hypothetical protein